MKKLTYLFGNGQKNVKILVCLMLAVMSQQALAQSCDATYPIGHWWNMPPGESDKGINVEVFIDRGPDNPTSGHNRNECGSIYVTDNETDKTLVDVDLFYSGKGLDSNGMPTGVYYFQAKAKDGKTSRLAIRLVETNQSVALKVECTSGALVNHAFLKETIYGAPGAMGSYADPTPGAENDKDLLERLRMADTDPEILTPGFGNRKLFIKAHANLISGKPKYAKPKGTTAINIRKDCNTSAEKIGELKPNTTLQVIDEYNGWCQVRMSDKQFGWLSLSVVTLTNTEGISAFEPTYPPTVDGHVAFLGIPLNVSPANMKSQLLAKGFKVEGEDGGWNITLQGVAYGVKSRVNISIGEVNGKEGCIYSMWCMDAKLPRLPQAKARYAQLIKKMESIYGKGTPAQYGDSYEIKVGKGVVGVSYFNEDEMDGSSDFYVVQTYYQDAVK